LQIGYVVEEYLEEEPETPNIAVGGGANDYDE
jgi:hypothetical protein